MLVPHEEASPRDAGFRGTVSAFSKRQNKGAAGKPQHDVAQPEMFVTAQYFFAGQMQKNKTQEFCRAHIGKKKEKK